MDSIMMKTEQQHHQDDDFQNGQWVDIADYHSSQHQSPAHEYNGFAFVSPMEPTYNRPIQPSYSTHQSLHPLIMPQWPSMLTNPGSSVPPIMPLPSSLAPASTIASAHPLPPVASSPAPSTQRRTLTDQDRRRMCQYHEDNPTVKQTEIGSMFGVERSTVSKVLRQKDKYLFPDDGSRSPIKRSKGKFPDIERALSNWARNHQRQGLPLSDGIIRDKARFFATTVGSSECHVKVNSISWLEKFKQKNHLLGARPRKGSETETEGGLNAESRSGSDTPNGISPISPLGLAPCSPDQSHENSKTDSPDSYIDFSASYRHAHSQSATSLATCYSDTTAPSSFSGDPRSPPSPFYSPDSSCGRSPFSPSQQAHLPPLASTNTVRPRSQTFPMVGVEPSYITPPASAEPQTPNYLQQSLSTPVLESPIEELPEPPLSIDSAVHSHSHHSPQGNTPSQSSSPTSMAPPPNPSGSSSNVSSPVMGPPSQDEARRALETLMTFFQHQPSGVVDPQEYITMGKLMEKLKLQGTGLPGGMHSMDVGDREGKMGPVGRKRSMRSL
ncbi:hypothetical protein MMC12_007359 [Toensbergia leucococca]|nr:hypothetical protein [Toensbergia leucococca]